MIVDYLKLKPKYKDGKVANNVFNKNTITDKDYVQNVVKDLNQTVLITYLVTQKF